MSKTDKTAPYHVKWFYEPNFLEAVHRHESHECNLPPKPKTGRELQRYWSGQPDAPCFWWPSFAFFRSRWAKCNCSMCKRWAYEKSPAERQRLARKKYCQDGWQDEY